MKFTDEEGKVWKWRGEYRQVKQGDYFLSGEGKPRINLEIKDASYIRAILHPVLPIHEFGGVRFEETGEVRQAQPGEWYLIVYSDSTQGPNYNSLTDSATRTDRIILRPRLEGLVA